MRKLIVFLLVLAITGCAGTVEQQKPEEVDHVATIVAATMEAVMNAPESTPVQEATVEEQEAEIVMGTRSNPVPIGQPLPLVYMDIANFQLTLLEVVRGEEAWSRIIQANQFNEPPLEGMEYILAKVGANYQTATEVDYNLTFDSYSFKSVSKNQILDSPSVVLPEPEFNVNLFPGGSAEGWVAVQVYVDDPAPLVLYNDFLSLDNFYFSTTQ